MSIITIPTGLLFGSFELTQQRFDTRETSEVTGATKSRLLAPPRWRLSIGSPSPGVSPEQAALWKTMLMQLRGGINHLAAYDPVQVAPRGTMRGTLTMSATASAGATAISFTGGAGQAGRTILRGDWLQLGTGLGSHYCMAAADATANGSGVITGLAIEPPVRQTIASGTSVTWDKPVAHYRMTNSTNSWARVPGTVELMTGFGADFIESFT